MKELINKIKTAICKNSIFNERKIYEQNGLCENPKKETCAYERNGNCLKKDYSAYQLTFHKNYFLKRTPKQI
jgi:hypothetical protein